MQKDPRTFEIIGAAIEVHRELGLGFLEGVYQEAFSFVCFDSIIVEVKALGQLTGIEESQVINYLKASGHSTGLLLNFGARSLQHKRLVLSPKKSA